MRGRKVLVKSRDCALASDLVRAEIFYFDHKIKNTISIKFNIHKLKNETGIVAKFN